MRFHLSLGLAKLSRASMFLVLSTLASCSVERPLTTPQEELPRVLAVQGTGEHPPAVARGSWPSFRGLKASGIAASSAPLPVAWDITTGANIAWTAEIPGLGHSSPVVWGNQVFVTSAVRSDGKEPYLRVGLYGESPDNPEEIVHHYRVYCLDKQTGAVVWERTACSAIPQVQRHIKASHANSTPATNGTYVVAFFGSQGLYCYTLAGDLVWQQDLGYLDSGAFDVPDIQWGFGSSPIIFDDMVITLCDVNNQSFLAAYSLRTGEQLWRTDRDEVPTWGTPNVAVTAQATQVIVNGYHHIGGYDITDGAELWWMRGGGDIPVPTPLLAHGMVFFSNAHGRLRPLYAVDLDARGDITLASDQTSNQYVAWSNPRRGAYIPTPLIWGDYFFVLSDNGVLTCYEARTGAQQFRERLAGQRGAYSASPVGSDGKLYFTSEHGDVHVLLAAATYHYLASSSFGEPCMATPAISDDLMLFRTSKRLVAVREMGAVVSGTMQRVTPAPTPAAEVARLAPVDVNDPLSILQRLDAAVKQVEGVRYTITVQGTDALTARLGTVTAEVAAAGSADSFPERFLITANVLLPPSTEPVTVTAGCDGNQYYLIDHAHKRVHQDFERSVMGSLATPVLGTIVREFHLAAPFEQELSAPEHVLEESTTVAGEPCFQIRISYGETGDQVFRWLVSQNDFLPRGRRDHFPMGEGVVGGYVMNLEHLEVNPELADELFQLEVPPGYQITDEAYR